MAVEERLGLSAAAQKELETLINVKNPYMQIGADSVLKLCV
jgi:hypothetical protein